MNIYVAIQNTVAQIPGMTIQSISKQSTFWKIIVVKEDIFIHFELDEASYTVCVIEKKNVGYKSISRFMKVFLEEVDGLEPEEEDPVALAPVRD